MKEFSQEIINIDGVDYTLFLNRKGIVAWENITKAGRKQDELREKAEKVVGEEEIVIKDGDNPFEISGVNDVLDVEEQTKEYYKKLYWIMLYENHKLDYKDVLVLFEKAEKDYGFTALAELAMQMLEDANLNRVGNAELKKLAALRPKKN